MNQLELEDEIRELEIQIEELETRNLIPIGISTDFSAIDALDPTISKLFIESQTPKLGERVSKRTRNTLEMIQLENVNRMFGVTSFKITNDSDNTLLGLRFDVFNQFKSQYVAPHYIILKKIVSNLSLKDTNQLENTTAYVWSIFKSTLPKYIPFNELANKYLPFVDLENPLKGIYLGEFTSEIYNQLDKIEIKKSQIQSLQSQVELQYGNQVHIKYDLNLYKVTITVLGRIEIIILIDLDSVLSAVVVDDKREINSSQRRAIEQLLTHSNANQLNEIGVVVIKKIFDLVDFR